MIRVEPGQAPTFFASKWIHYDLLIAPEAMKSLMEHLGANLFSTLGVTAKDGHQVEQDAFLDNYRRYIETLKEGKVPDEAAHRFFFTLAITKTLDALRAIDLPGDKEVIVPYAPLIQMQMHRFNYSPLDGKFHSMSFGEKSITWGVRLSYPQLYQSPETRIVEDATDETKFVNSQLFQTLKSWVRANTQPTPFVIDGKKQVEPMRVDKETLAWVANHPQLAQNGLAV